jgi:hypothetical protein
MPPKTAKPRIDTAQSSASDPKFGMLDIYKLSKLIVKDFKEISKSAAPIARNWATILEPLKKLTAYLGAQVSSMADEENPDPSWKNVSAKANLIIKKLEPIITTLSEEKLAVAPMLHELHVILEQVPGLFATFGKLQLHNNVEKQMLHLVDQLKLEDTNGPDFPNFVLEQLETHFPQFKSFKEGIEIQYLKFRELDNLADFSRLSVFQKMALLTAMQEFNNVIQALYLELNRISLNFGIKKGYLLQRPIFNDKTITINSLCQDFTAFYKKAIVKAKVAPQSNDSFYPLQGKIIQQQIAMLEQHMRGEALAEDILKTKIHGYESIIKLLNIKIPRLKETDQPSAARFMEFFSESYSNDPKQDPDTAFKKAYGRLTGAFLKGKLNDKLKTQITLIITETNEAVAQAKIKAEYKEKYLKIRIKHSLDEYPEYNHASVAQSSDDNIVVVPAATKLATATNILMNIFQQLKESKALIDTRSSDKLAATITLQLQAALKNPNITSVERDNISHFLNNFSGLVKNNKNKMSKIIKECLAQCKKENLDFTLNEKLLQEIFSPPTFSLMTTIETAVKYIDGQLATMLDEGIYAQFIALQSDGPENFNSNGWIKNTGLTLAKLKEALAKYKELSAYLQTGNMKKMEGVAAGDQLISFANVSLELSVLTKDLLSQYITLENDPYVKTLLSVPGLKQMLFPGSAISDPVENPEPNLENQANNQPDEPLDKVFNIASALFEKAAVKYIYAQDARIHDTISAMARIKNLTNEYQKLKRQPTNKIYLSNTKIFGFVLTHTVDLFPLMHELPSALNAIKSVSKKELSVFANQLNLALRDLVLMFNRIEIEFNLAPGYFTKRSLNGLLSSDMQQLLHLNQLPNRYSQSSLDDLIAVVYENLEKLNYSVPEQERYPFTNTVIAQEQQLYHSTQDHTLRHDYIKYFLNHSKKTSIRESTLRTQTSTAKNKLQADQINALINANIQQLNNERDANQTILKALLQKLTQNDSSLETLTTKLSQMGRNETDRDYIYLLYRGHSKKLMETLAVKSATRADLLHELDISIAKLSQKRTQNYYFFAKSRRTHLENTIEAYQQLKQFLKHQGSKVTDFAEEQPYLYKLLVDHDKPLLERLLKQSEESFCLKDEKRITGDVYPSPEPALDKATFAAIKNYQNSVMAARISELKSPVWFVTSTRAKKIELLIALTEHLKDKSLERSLAIISKDKILGSDFYLLHEGKTGKMLKVLSQSTLSKKDMIDEIKVEIARLQQQRHNRFYFSEKSKKSIIESRIQACTELAKLLEKSKVQTNISEAIEFLDPKHRKILLAHETKLLEQLKQWDKMNLAINAPAPQIR